MAPIHLRDLISVYAEIESIDPDLDEGPGRGDGLARQRSMDEEALAGTPSAMPAIAAL